MADNFILQLTLKAKDSLSGVVKSAVQGADKDLKKLQEQLKGTAQKFDDFGRRATLAGGALLGISAVNTKVAADFEKSMANVSTLIDTNTESIEDMGQEVLNISKRTPVAINDLTEGLYNIRSAGVDAADQFTVLEKSAQLAVTGLGSTNEAVDVVTSSMNAFGLKGKDAGKVYDNLFKVVKYGKTDLTGIAQGFGATAGVIASSKIELDEYLASVSAMTTVGNPASQAHTQLKAAVAGLTRGTKEQQAIFNQMGAKDFKDLIQKSGGMVGAFEKINNAVGGNSSKIIQLVGSIEAYNAIASLTGERNEVFKETIDAMRNGADAFSEGYEKQLNTLSAKQQILNNNIKSLSISFGTALIPLVGALATTVGKVVNWFDRMPKPVKSFVAISVAGIGAVLVTMGGLSFAIGGVIKSFSGMLSAYKTVHTFIMASNSPIASAIMGIGRAMQLACLHGSIAFRALGTAIMTTPVIGWIIAGITLIGVVVGLVVRKYWKPIVGFFKGFFEGIKEGIRPLLPIFKSVFGGISPIVKKVGGIILKGMPIYWIIKGLIEIFKWFKNLLKPVDDVGGKAQNMGKTIGLAIAGAINWCVKLIAKLKDIITLGGRIKIGGKNNGEISPVDGSHANGLDYVPKDGYVAELHKGESVLTKSEAAVYRSQKFGSTTITYAPNITLTATGANATENFKKLLRQHKEEIAALIESVNKRRLAGAYA